MREGEKPQPSPPALWQRQCLQICVHIEGACPCCPRGALEGTWTGTRTWTGCRCGCGCGCAGARVRGCGCGCACLDDRARDAAEVAFAAVDHLLEVRAVRGPASAEQIASEARHDSMTRGARPSIARPPSKGDFGTAGARVAFGCGLWLHRGKGGQMRGLASNNKNNELRAAACIFLRF